MSYIIIDYHAMCVLVVVVVVVVVVGDDLWQSPLTLLSTSW